MLITEELFLLLTTDGGQVEGLTTQRGYGLAAAAITDLVLAERVSLGDEKDPHVRVASSVPLGDDVLDPALVRLCEKEGKKLSALVGDRKLNPERAVASRLARGGIVELHESSMLGLRSARYPVRDPGPERLIRERLRSVLSGAAATPQDAALLSILQGLGVAPRVLKNEAGAMRAKELKQRIIQVSSACQAGPAVKRSVDAINAAIVTAAIVPVIAATVTG